MKASADGFWDDMEAAQKVTQRAAQLKDGIERYEKLVQDYHDTLTLIGLADEEGDLSLLEECTAGVNHVEASLDEQRLATLLTGEYDSRNAILTFHAGAGGTEAQDWARDALPDVHPLDRTARFQLQDSGLSRWRRGRTQERQHPDQRTERLWISQGGGRGSPAGPDLALRRLRTAAHLFAAVEVLPELDDSIQVEIRPEDIKMDVFRSSGAGGQHINKTSSAVRLTHIPTGIVVSCQTERSQFQNRDTAMNMLKAKLLEIKEREHLERIEDIKGSQAQIAWGSQIRSYVFMPYTLAKDHRTGYEMGNIGAVMDGDIDGFINAYLKAAANGTLGAPEE